MQALYHMSPIQAIGDILCPLIILQQPYPTIYEHEAVKYQVHQGV
jgi:hypothetical protein